MRVCVNLSLFACSNIKANCAEELVETKGRKFIQTEQTVPSNNVKHTTPLPETPRPIDLCNLIQAIHFRSISSSFDATSYMFAIIFMQFHIFRNIIKERTFDIYFSITSILL